MPDRIVAEEVALHDRVRRHLEQRTEKPRDDERSLERAVAGAYGVFSVQDYWEHGGEAEVRQGKALAGAAAKAGTQHFVYSSVGCSDRRTGLGHFESKWEIEGHIRALGLPATTQIYRFP